MTREQLKYYIFGACVGITGSVSGFIAAHYYK